MGVLPVNEGVYSLACSILLGEAIQFRPTQTRAVGGPLTEEPADVVTAWVRRDQISQSEFFGKGYGPFYIEGLGFAEPSLWNIPDYDENQQTNLANPPTRHVPFQELQHHSPLHLDPFLQPVESSTPQTAVSTSEDRPSKRKHSIDDDEGERSRTSRAPPVSPGPGISTPNHSAQLHPSPPPTSTSNVGTAEGIKPVDDSYGTTPDNPLLHIPRASADLYNAASEKYPTHRIEVDKVYIYLPRSERPGEKGLIQWEKAPPRKASDKRHVHPPYVRILQELHALVAGYLVVKIAGTLQTGFNVQYLSRTFIYNTKAGADILEALWVGRCATLGHPSIAALFEAPLRELLTLKKIWVTQPPRSLRVKLEDNIFYNDPTNRHLQITPQGMRAVFQTAVALRCVQMGMREEKSYSSTATETIGRLFVQEAEILFNRKLTLSERERLDLEGLDPSSKLCRSKLFRQSFARAFTGKRSTSGADNGDGSEVVSSFRLVGDPKKKVAFDPGKINQALGGIKTLYGGCRRVNKKLGIAPGRPLKEEVPSDVEDVLDETDDEGGGDNVATASCAIDVASGVEKQQQIEDPSVDHNLDDTEDV